MPPNSTPDRANPAPRPRCIVIDDDRDFLKLAQMVVARLRPSFEFRGFLSAGEALAAVREQRPQLIISDVRMPVMDGFQFVRAVRATDTSVPIIMISAEDRATEALAHGATVFLNKELFIAGLAEAVAEIGVANGGWSVSAPERAG